MMSSPLSITEHPTHVLARLNRPEKKNAIDSHVVAALHELCADLETTPQTLVLTGAGDSFAAGADIEELRARGAAEARAGINTHVFMRVHALPMPVLAVVHGYALGGGAELAYAADIRIGCRGATIGNPETSLGIIAAAGATWRLREIVGEALASDMLLTGRLLTAEEAAAAGLFTYLLDTPAAAIAQAQGLAAAIAKLDPAATQATKRVLAAPRGAHPGLDLAEQASLFESPAKQRRMTAFLERKRGGK